MGGTKILQGLIRPWFSVFSFLILCYQTAKLLTPGGQYNQDEIIKCMIKIFMRGGGGRG